MVQNSTAPRGPVHVVQGLTTRSGSAPAFHIAMRPPGANGYFKPYQNESCHFAFPQLLSLWMDVLSTLRSASAGVMRCVAAIASVRHALQWVSNVSFIYKA